MNVIFVGSIENNVKDYGTITNNLKLLVKTILRHGNGLVIRKVEQETGNRTPIDCIVYEALVEYHYNNHINNKMLTIFKEPEVGSSFIVNLPHTSHTATTSLRIEFYKELLSLVDIVVGIGGEYGLPRLMIAAEFFKKPIFLLPGAGGTTDFLWREFFKKSYPMSFLSDKDRLRIKQVPYINEASYGDMDIIYDLILQTKIIIERGVSKEDDPITPDNITLKKAWPYIWNSSLSLWVVILGLILFIITTTVTATLYFAKDKSISKKDSVPSTGENEKTNPLGTKEIHPNPEKNNKKGEASP